MKVSIIVGNPKPRSRTWQAAHRVAKALEPESISAWDLVDIGPRPAIVAKPTDPDVKEIFLPSKVVRDLGYHLEPDELIVDPSLHRTSVIEQERLDRRLGDTATTYVERGFQPPTGWRRFVVAAIVVALGSALAVTGRASASRSGRVLLRVSGGSPAILRLFAACRVGFGAACGTTLGAAAGCAIGLLLVWPMTASIDWDPPPRVAFETPWPLICALVIGLPVLATAVAGLALPGMTARIALRPSLGGNPLDS